MSLENNLLLCVDDSETNLDIRHSATGHSNSRDPAAILERVTQETFQYLRVKSRHTEESSSVRDESTHHYTEYRSSLTAHPNDPARKVSDDAGHTKGLKRLRQTAKQTFSSLL